MKTVHVLSKVVECELKYNKNILDLILFYMNCHQVANIPIVQHSCSRLLTVRRECKERVWERRVRVRENLYVSCNITNKTSSSILLIPVSKLKLSLLSWDSMMERGMVLSFIHFEHMWILSYIFALTFSSLIFENTIYRADLVHAAIILFPNN